MTSPGISDIAPWAYVGVLLLVWRLCLRGVRHEMVDSYKSRPTEWIDVVFCMFFATLVAAAWPVWALPAVFARASRRRLQGPDDYLRFIGGESKRERLARQQERIAELERELSIR